ncbi:hypothetical protein BDW69DRAFT_204142 [Aspergillus filifer]
MKAWSLLLTLFYIFVFPAQARAQAQISTIFLPELSASRLFQRDLFTRARLNPSQVALELGALVTNTTIYGTDDLLFEKVTERWNTFAAPNVQRVTHCAQNSIDFLPVNRSHGYPVSLASFTGIQINMARLTAIELNYKDADPRLAIAEMAWFQAGVYTKQVADYLWERGYIMTTGTCECVGLLGLGLGGGHGRLEGTYGLVSDNIRQLNVILADGAAITVNGTSHADLFCAMRGAGHNFGIDTSFEMSIFPRASEADAWAWNTYIWHPSISSTEPVLTWSFAYRGSSRDARDLLAKVGIDDIPSVSHQSGESPYPGIARVQGFDTQSPVCSSLLRRMTSTAGLQVYNITTEQRIFNSFVETIASYPDIATSTFIFHEGYAMAAVENGDGYASAYPFRDDHHLMLFYAGLPNDWAFEVGDLHDYVNYAIGFEDVSEVYGAGWRIDRLKMLKERYDPGNAFRFHNPIIRD